MKQSKRKRAATAQATPADSRASDNVIAVAIPPAAETAAANAEAANGASVAQRAQSDVLKLGANCTVRDCSQLKSELLDLLAHREPVAIDVGGVERIDTAAMQVLCAFVRDRQASGGQVRWIGQAPGFAAAVRLLGLQKALGVPDAQMAAG